MPSPTVKTGDAPYPLVVPFPKLSLDADDYDDQVFPRVDQKVESGKERIRTIDHIEGAHNEGLSDAR